MKETTRRHLVNNKRTTATSELDDVCLAYSDAVAWHNTTLAKHLEARQCKNL